jgi:hypothetical protein
MPARECAEVEYQELTRPLRPLRPRQQIRRLKHELFHAIARAYDFQDRARASEGRVAELEALAMRRPDERDPTIKRLQDDSEPRARDPEQGLSASRREVEGLQTHCAELESLCQALLSTIEHAALMELPPSATDVAEPAAHATA